MRMVSPSRQLLMASRNWATVLTFTIRPVRGSGGAAGIHAGRPPAEASPLRASPTTSATSTKVGGQNSRCMGSLLLGGRAFGILPPMPKYREREFPPQRHCGVAREQAEEEGERGAMGTEAAVTQQQRLRS